MDKMEIKILNEILVNHVKGIKENSNGLQSMLLKPYVELIKTINNQSLPKTYLHNRMHAICFAIIEKIGEQMDNPIEGEVDARGRLNEIYNLIRPVLDEVTNEFKEGRKERCKEHQDLIDNLSPQMVEDDMKGLHQAMKDIISSSTSIVAVNVDEEFMEQMEKAKNGTDNDRKEFMKKVFSMGL